jgi:hypothetical protein
MKTASVVVVSLLALLGCGQPVPAEKAAYVGEWKEKNMVLSITQEGSVRYKRVKGNTTTSVDGQLKRFEGNNFEVGIGPMTTMFVVSKAPYQDGKSWKMTVDGVELTRSAP